jgi:S1-C subfamily serine protease
MKRRMINILIWVTLAVSLVSTLEALTGCHYELKVHGVNRGYEHRLNMIERTMGSVAKVVATGWEHRPATGFYIGNGIIVSAGHVVEYEQLDKVIFENGEEYPILDRYRHPDYDCGFFVIDEPNAPALRLDTRELQRGETIYVFGHPKEVTFTVSKGIVSGRTDMDGYFGEVLLGITDAVAHQGNSGSPAVNENGEVRGMYVGSYRALTMDGHFPAGCSVFISAFDIVKALNQMVEEKS